MNRLKQQRPSFLWQAVLILSPVGLLVGFGLFSLSRDRHLAQQQAVQNAQTLADTLAAELWEDTTEVPPGFEEWRRSRFRPDGPFDRFLVFQLGPDGELRFPPPFDPVPIPQPTPQEKLTEPQAAQWRKTRLPRSDPEGTTQSLIEAFQRFLALEPPQPFLARAQFDLAQLLTSHDATASAGLFRAIASSPAETPTESGLPLRLLAQWKLLQLTNATPSPFPETLPAFCSNLVAHPSALTPYLLQQAASLQPTALDNVPPELQPAQWNALWENHQEIRDLHARAVLAAKGSLNSSAPLFWIPGEDVDWLASKVSSDDDGAWYVCRQVLIDPTAQQNALNRRDPTLLWRMHANDFRATRTIDPARLLILGPHLPISKYFALSLTIAGRPLIPTNTLHYTHYLGGGKSSAARWTELETLAPPPPLAISTRRVQSGSFLQVGVHLVSPQMFYADQRARTVLFGVLILTSALAALVGCFAAWRAFRKQQHLSEMKTNFVSSVSHELRAPIASIRLMAEGLQSGRVQTNQKRNEYFRFIARECHRLSALIQNVLDFSRIEQQRDDYDLEPTDLTRVMEETLELMKPAAAEKEIELRFSSQGQPHPVLADGRALQQALVNILDNALKHSPAQTTVETGCEFRPSQPTTLWVQDHGPGIPIEDQAHIFDRFYRCGSELRRHTEGIGIGLSIVRHIIKAHHGRITLQSEPGHGSRFTIELPASPDHELTED